MSVNLKPKEWNLLRDEFRALMRDESVHEDSIEMFLDEQIRRRFGEAAASDARLRFDVSDQISAYLDWYGEIAEGRPGFAPPRPRLNSASADGRGD